MLRRLLALAAFAVGVSLGFSNYAAAQVPGSANPGRIEERFKTPPVPKSAPEIEIPGPEAPLPPEKAQAIKFQLASVVVDGATVFSQADFESLYAPLLGKEVTLAQIYDLRDAITAKYRKAGYVLSQAIIPPQKIANGIVHIQVVEGYIDHIEYQGESGDRRGLIAAMADKITRCRPLNVHVLERYVLLVSDIPGVTVRTVIKPDKDTPGAADLVLILGHDTVSGTVEADNRGSKAIGPEQGQIEVDLNSLFGLDEQTIFQAATTGQPKELQYGRFASDWILSPEGVRLDLSGSYSHTKPSGAIAILDPTGYAVNASGFVDYPFIRSRAKNVNFSAGFTYLNSVTKLLGAQFSNDRLRYLTLRATFDAADTFLGDALPASNLIDAEASQGIDMLDASRNGAADLSRANGHSDFSLIDAAATRIQTLADRISLKLSLTGQIAGTPLLTPVQFGLGGSEFGCGYEPSELTGDEGIAGSVEGRYDIPFVSKIIGQPQIYAFYDAGEIWNRNALPGTPAHASLTSAGAGIRFIALGRFDVDFELAKPLTRRIASRGDKNIRPLFNISTQF